MDPRLSYHNTVISYHCIGISTDKEMIENFHRMTFDDCLNITHIDGKKVVGGNLVYRLAE